MNVSFDRRHFLPAVVLLAAIGVACSISTSERDASTPTASLTPRSSPAPAQLSPPAEIRATPTGNVAKYASFAQGFADALQREDASWFAGRLQRLFPCSSFHEPPVECRDAPSGARMPAISARRWGGGGFIAGESRFYDLVLARFRAVDREVEDEYGPGQLQLYAVGEQQLPTDLLIVHLLVTGLLVEPERGRWALVFRAERSNFEPNDWELTQLIEVPPDSTREVLSLGVLPEPPPDPETYPAGFAEFLNDLEGAVDRGDRGFIVARLGTWPYTCTVPPPPILSVPSCDGRPDGTTVEVVPWNVYCTACDVTGLATRDEVAAWLDRLFATSQDAPADDLGPAEVVVDSVAYRTIESKYAVTITGVGDLGTSYFPRPPGRWLITLAGSDKAGAWRIEDLTLGDPGNSRWVLESLRGTNIVWTRWPPID